MLRADDAPEGYRAVRATSCGCVGCDFQQFNPRCPGWGQISKWPASCFADMRRDRLYVWFIKSEPAS